MSSETKSDIFVVLASGFSAIIMAKLGAMELTLEEEYTVVCWRTFGSVALYNFFRSR